MATLEVADPSHSPTATGSARFREGVPTVVIGLPGGPPLGPPAGFSFQ
jgi:hypothetical protein